MKFKKLILSSLVWRGMYFITVLLLNILVSRYFQAKGSGWIYYITNYFSFILLVASLSLESGMTYFASQNTIPAKKLATLSIVWSLLVSLIILSLVFIYYKHPHQELARTQFIFFGSTYITGILLTTFFCALFYAQQDYAVPNMIMTGTNLMLIVSIPLAILAGNRPFIYQHFLNLYFFTFLAQGILLALAYLQKNKILWEWSLPSFSDFKPLIRYSIFALFTNIIFFLLYRIDYWFVKNTCQVCQENDLGNYIQVSKIGQMFLLLPTIIASAIFPRTASGYREQVNSALSSMVKAVLYGYLLVMGGLMIVGPWLFPWVYGETFNLMYQPFLILIPGILSLSALTLLTAYNSGKNKIITNTKGSVIGLVIIIVGDWLLIPRYGIKAAAAVSSVGYVCYFTYILMVFRKEYNASLRDFFIPVKGDWTRLKRLFQPEPSSRENIPS